MNSRPFIVFIWFLAIFVYAANVHAQAVANGQVVDAASGKPLPGAHIYLSGTTIGTAANLSGQYRLRNIPAGGYRIVVSRVGYGTQITDFIIGPGEQQAIDFELNTVVYELPEIYVGDLDKGWKKNVRRFADHFIGQTEWADSVKIINPEVLRFNKKWWGKMSAEALAPLQIENRALGYRITYHLEEFEHSGTRTRWDGEPLFTEMTPADSAQATYWERNRRKAFNGSIRHFLLALLDDRLKEEGFRLYDLRDNAYNPASPNRYRTDGQRFIREADKDFLHHFSFSGRLEIKYVHEEEDPEYVRWSGTYGRGRSRVQTSYLKLNERPITVDSDGEILEPYGATQFGYYAFSRLADLTPRGYRPEGFATSTSEAAIFK